MTLDQLMLAVWNKHGEPNRMIPATHSLYWRLLDWIVWRERADQIYYVGFSHGVSYQLLTRHASA